MLPITTSTTDEVFSPINIDVYMTLEDHFLVLLSLQCVVMFCRSPRVSAVSKPGVIGTRVSASGCQLSPDSAIMAAMPFCSELILWRVSPVGPLSKSGGLTELARINSPAVSAFTNVAWLPTLLPRLVVVIIILLS